MGFKPERTGPGGWVYASLLPPRSFVPVSMDLAMMAAAERYREFVANLSAKRAVLREAQMMWVGGRTSANQTWLFGDGPYMIAIANSAGFGVAKFALVDARGGIPSGQLKRFDFRAFAC